MGSARRRDLEPLTSGATPPPVGGLYPLWARINRRVSPRFHHFCAGGLAGGGGGGSAARVRCHCLGAVSTVAVGSGRFPGRGCPEALALAGGGGGGQIVPGAGLYTRLKVPLPAADVPIWAVPWPRQPMQLWAVWEARRPRLRRPGWAPPVRGARRHHHGPFPARERLTCGGRARVGGEGQGRPWVYKAATGGGPAYLSSGLQGRGQWRG